MRKFLLFLALIAIISNSFPQSNSRENNDNRDWTIIATYTIPGKASGLAWDGQFLYSGLYSAPGDDNLIYKIDPADGSYSLQCAGPIDKAYGLTFDSNSGNLWTTQHPGAYDPGLAVEFDLNGNYVSEFELPATYFSGIAYDNGFYWVNCYYDPDGEVYLLDNLGTIINQFAAPGAQPWDICTEGNDLWVVDYNDNQIYKIDNQGTVLESHSSENAKPSGVVFDGTYLWYVDGGLNVESNLYKIDLSGSGNPDINVPQTSHDYGIVTINTTATWSCIVQNNGNAALQVTYGNISGDGSSDIDWPQGSGFTVDANSSETIHINYSPITAGPLDALGTLLTNDPVTAEVDLTMTGTAVNPGPFIVLKTDTNDYGEVRIGAHTRWDIEIENKGDENLIVNGFTFSDTVHFYAEQRDSMPFTLAPLEAKKVGIWFNPDDKNAYSSEIDIASNDPTQNPISAYLTGEGLAKIWPMGDIFWDYNISGFFDNSPKAILDIPDVTGDDIDDVIICSEDNYIRCLNGNADGHGDVIWGTSIYSGSVYQQNCITLTHDINNDGYQDIIVGTAWGDRSIVALSGFSGAILWKHQTNEYGDGGWVYQVDCSYDYNDDGLPDVLAATGDDGGNTGPKRVFCLDVRTGNTIWDSPMGGPVFSVIGIEDFTGDGVPDVIAGASNEQESVGYVYGLDGSNGNQEWQFVTQGTAVWALGQLDDVDDSGTNDIILGASNGKYYIVDPVSPTTIYTGSIGNYLILRFVILDDVNQDGFKDVLVAHSGKKAVILDGAEGGDLVNTALNDKSWCVARIDDLSGDNINDAIIGTLYEDNYVYFVNSTHGNIMFEDNFGEPIDAINSIADINGDYSMEMVAGGRNGKIVCYSGGLDSAVGTDEIKTGNNKEIEHGCYPNPFTNQTVIYFNLPNDDHVTVRIIDQQGRRIATLIDKVLQGGKHELMWNTESGKNLSRGIYTYNIITSKTVVSGKLVLVK